MIITVDPGKSGGIAWEYDGEVYAEKMPDGPDALWSFLQELNSTEKIDIAYVENVGFHRKGNNAMASVTFSRHVGNIESTLIALGIPIRWVGVKEWPEPFEPLPTPPPKATKKQRQKAKQDRKNSIKDQAQELFPDIKVTLALSDALGILHWALLNFRPCN